MRLRYLSTAELGLRWRRHYYRSNPQLSLRAASDALATAESTLLAFPASAALFEDMERLREYHIRGTPFCLLYTVTPDEVLIIDVRDTRGRRSADVVRRFLAGLPPAASKEE